MRLIRFIFSRIFICLVLIAALFAAIIFLCVYIHSLLPAAWALGIAGVFSLATAIYIMGRPSPHYFKCAWLALVAALPLLGALVYFVFTAEPPRKCTPQNMAVCCGLENAEYFPTGEAYLGRLAGYIACAEKYILLEYFIIARGRVWSGIFAALKDALARGVKVCIIYDGLGSALRAPTRSFRALKRAGAEIKVFRKPFPLPFCRFNSRDHRKLAVIDGRAVFTGGVNIADEYANLASPCGYWKDGGVLLRGEIAEAFAQLFDGTFCPQKDKKKGGTDNERVRHPSELKDGQAMAIADGAQTAGGVYEDFAASLIYSAKRRVNIFTPYLCAGEKLTDALTFAARRGADVKIMIPHIPDKRITFEITRTFADALAEEGVEVYEFAPGFMHFKAIVCDDCALVGSYNFDFRSMRSNSECAVAVRGGLADRIAADFDNCLADGIRRVAVKSSAPRRFFRRILALFAPLV